MEARLKHEFPVRLRFFKTLGALDLKFMEAQNSEHIDRISANFRCCSRRAAHCEPPPCWRMFWKRGKRYQLPRRRTSGLHSLLAAGTRAKGYCCRLVFHMTLMCWTRRRQVSARRVK
ncbi:unnamed protein product [Spodoptera littoralis]|uniref:Uncharacterized protein n=1 Tax=Spodoptera littoralis TaxID=7109 RepID=A0A9P0N1T0_SPOLI|nr:unnamed protein product [Spodoptera littoralis]CAH1638466.1 unnamed protein product [Spodoptera littoralis]